MMEGRWTLNSDGGARGNPGPGGAGIILRAPDGSIAVRGGAFLGSVTNNVAEYEALLWGLRAARALGVSDLVVKADSELVVRQLRGEYRVKNEGLKPLFLQAQALRRGFDALEFVHVRRADNADADALANEAMDGRCVVGDAPEPPSAGDSRLFE
ncbi:MAG: ribonuclease HI family protein [Coriobacteriia bacterium]|jgi:ribonuclease HI